MADTTLRVFLGIASSDGSIENATVVSGDYKNIQTAQLPTSYAKVADITNFPELIGDSDDIESTTMSDTQRTYENGLQNAPTDSFTAQYSREKFEAIQDLIDANGRNAKYHFCLLFSDSSSVFDWRGSINVGIGAGSINEIITMPLPISFASAVKLRKGYDGEYKADEDKIIVSQRT
jgi:hypothetical protein